MTHRRAQRWRGLAAALLVAALPGCRLGTWGPSVYEPAYVDAREAWEIPLGWLALPFAVPLDVAASLALSLAVGLLNPINWLLFALEEPLLVPVIYLLPLTASALTLANPNHNLDWAADAPEAMVGFLDDEDEEDDDEGWDDEDATPAERERRKRWREERERADEARRRANERDVEHHHEMQRRARRNAGSRHQR